VLLRDTPWVALSLFLAASVGLALRALGISEPSIVLVFVLGVAVIAYRTRPLSAVIAAVLAVALFNFFFTRPLYSFEVHDPGYLVTFSVMLAIGLSISRLVGRVRMQERAAALRADVNDILLRTSRRLGAVTGSLQIATELREALAEYLQLETVVFACDPGTAQSSDTIGSERLASSPRERFVAEWTYQHAAESGRATDTFSDAQAWYLPLVSRRVGVFGVLGVAPTTGQRLSRDVRQVVTSIASIASQCLERESLTLAAQASAFEAQSERLRSDLLATVSHDLRTPLSTISGAAFAVMNSSRSTLSADDREMLRDAVTESERLTRLIENLLHLSRIEGSNPRTDWQSIDELVDAALKQVGRSADVSRVVVYLPPTPMMVWADGSLMTQVFINLLENALRYAPEGHVTLCASESENGMHIEIADEGPGFADDPPDRLFGRFVRGTSAASSSSRGSGLGLAICRAIVQAHGGSIDARNRPEGGALLTIELPYPRDQQRPTIQIEREAS
jgi:two-component system sensor histidine kinase KdpD